ncbi:MAG: VacJ family lipoprotein [Desulfuromonadales bacterium]|nr:VacJ family lipoprotein [Desulfuromonadales bacterium]
MLSVWFLLATLATATAADGETPVPAGPTAGLERDWTQLPSDEQELEVWDPLEPFNRGMFWFNDKLYFYALKPVAKGYRAVTPVPVRESFGNFFRNLSAPVRIVNSLLQFKITNTLDELTMFCANSTLGIGGLFDLRNNAPREPSPEDFGQTLGHYGTPPGFYLVLPVLGSTNARDAVGQVADSLTAPVPSPYYVKMETAEVAGLETFDTVNGLSLDKDTYEAIKRESLDPYLFVRNGFMQQRQAKVDK